MDLQSFLLISLLVSELCLGQDVDGGTYIQTDGQTKRGLYALLLGSIKNKSYISFAVAGLRSLQSLLSNLGWHICFLPIRDLDRDPVARQPDVCGECEDPVWHSNLCKLC